ncbi:MAG: hypothetical protein WAM51_01090 [Methylovirgula sp.]
MVSAVASLGTPGKPCSGSLPFGPDAFGAVTAGAAEAGGAAWGAIGAGGAVTGEVDAAGAGVVVAAEVAGVAGA